MEVCIKCQQYVSESLINESICVSCENAKENTVEWLQARILELELELQRQKATAEHGDRTPKVLWGDDFNSDSLH